MEQTMDRRDFLRLSGAAVAGTMATAHASEVGSQPKSIVFNDSGGASMEAAKRAYGEPFERETGIKVLITAPANIAKLKAMVQAGNVEWDVCELVSQEHKLAIKEGLIERLDRSIVNVEGLLPEAVDDYSLVWSYYSTIMGYRTERYPKGDHPKTWRDFWDVKRFPGRRALRNHPVDNLEFALMADGVPKDKLYPLDLDRAFKSLDRIKPHINVWWKDGAQPPQLLADGEVDLASGWQGRFYALAMTGSKRMAVEWNEGIVKLSWVAVPKGAKNKKEGMQLLALMTRAQAEAEYAKGISYTGANPKALDFLPAETKEWVVTNPQNRSRMALANEDWWLENLPKAQERWNNWFVG